MSYEIGLYSVLRQTTWLATGVKNPDHRVDVLGGYLFTSADVQVVMWIFANQQWTTVPFQIPNSNQLLGCHFYQQVLRCGAASNTSLLCRLSRGGHGVIGR